MPPSPQHSPLHSHSERDRDLGRFSRSSSPPRVKSNSSSTPIFRTPPSRTLFLDDIPKDIDQKALEELYKKYPGFKAVRRLPHFAFVEFASVEAASGALLGTKDYRFRSQDKPLIIDYDKGDSASKKRKDPERISSSKSKYERDDREREPERSTKEYRRSPDRRYEEDHRPRSTHEYGIDFPPSNSFLRGMPFSGFPSFPYASSPLSFPISRNEAATLFVANLPVDITEREMSILFRFMPGFHSVRLIVKRESKVPICFVDFADASCATYAMQNFQGIKLDPKDLVGLSIEYDKGKSFEPKDIKEKHRDAYRDKDRDRDRDRRR